MLGSKKTSHSIAVMFGSLVRIRELLPLPLPLALSDSDLHKLDVLPKLLHIWRLNKAEFADGCLFRYGWPCKTPYATQERTNRRSGAGNLHREFRTFRRDAIGHNQHTSQSRNIPETTGLCSAHFINFAAEFSSTIFITSRFASGMRTCNKSIQFGSFTTKGATAA